MTFTERAKCNCTIHNLNKLMQLSVMMAKTCKINVNDQQTQDNICLQAHSFRWQQI